MAIAAGVALSIVSFQVWALPGFLGALSTSATLQLGIGMGLLSVGLASVSKKNAGGSLLQSAQGRQVTSRQALAPRRVIYGAPPPVGGVITFMAVSGSNNEYLHLVITLSGHQVWAINSMYFDGAAVSLDGSGDATGFYSGYAHVEKNLGSAAQTAFAGLVAAGVGWTSAHRQRGCAGVYVRLKFDAANPADATIFPNGLPNITFDVDGALCYDPRSATTVWTQNAALITANYLTASYGLQAVYADEVDDAVLIAAANLCDENVNLNTSPVTTEKRYTIDCVFETSQTPGQILTQMVAAMAGAMTCSAKYAIYPGSYRTPAVDASSNPIILAEDDFVGPLTITGLVSTRTLFNCVKGTFINSLGVAVDFPVVDGTNGSTDWVAQDGGVKVYADVQYPMTNSIDRVQRISRILLEDQRRQVSIATICKMGAYRFRAQENVGVSLSHYSWTNKIFRADECNLSVQTDRHGVAALAVGLVLRETDSNVYAWSPTMAGAATSAATLTLPEAGTFTGTSAMVASVEAKS